MHDFFEMVYAYRLLLAKEEKLAIPLDADERAELLGLAQLLSGDAPSSDPRRAMPRVPSPLAVQFTLAGGFGSGQVRNASGGGLAIVTATPGEVGERTIVRVSLVGAGVEYVFPCRVMWVQKGQQPAMGVAFDGVPSRTSLRGRGHDPWSSPLRLGRRNTPIAA
jgi:hypothetical protein